MNHLKLETPGTLAHCGFTCRNLKPSSPRPAVVAFCVLFSALGFSAFAQGTAFTYQGRLMVAGVPANGSYDFRTAVVDSDNETALTLAGPRTNSAVLVSNGLFNLTLDFGEAAFTGASVWLELGVRPSGGGSFNTLVPRQPVTSAPYAIKAANAMTVNMGAISNPSFVGTTTSAPLALQVSNTVGLRLEYPTLGTVPNLVGGSSGNSVGASTQGAVIAGGAGNAMGIFNAYSAIGGGQGNNIAQGSSFSTISGGALNTIGQNSIYSAIGGGDENSIGANGGASVIGGGQGNSISPNAAFAVIPGGQFNTVGTGAIYAFAAGRRANASHPGTFVWADSKNADFASASSNQFLIRASGGVGINMTDPEAELHVFRGSAGVVSATSSTLLAVENNTNAFIQLLTPANSFSGLLFGSPVDSFDASVRYNSFGNRELAFRPGGNSTRMIILTNGNVGIGNNFPTERLHVAGNILATGTITPSSDRNLKKHFAPVDVESVLDRVAALPLQQWTYEAEDDAIRHLGPMAQDFHAAFGLGANDTTIATVDADGVALAAIQGLNAKVESGTQQAKAEMAQLRAENAALKARLDKLEQLLPHKFNGDTQ
jgi:trimeric autotransporter adhesin